MFGTLRRLAKKSQNEIVQQGVEELIATFRADLPNYDRGGGLN